MPKVSSRKSRIASFLFTATFFLSDSPSFTAQNTLSATLAKPDYFPLATGRFRMFCSHTCESSQYPLDLSHKHRDFYNCHQPSFVTYVPAGRGSPDGHYDSVLCPVAHLIYNDYGISVLCVRE